MSVTTNALTEDLQGIIDAGARSRPPRLHYLDGLRAVAALTVVLNDVFQQTFWHVPASGLLGRIAPWLQLGHYSVVLFITLSGFRPTLPVLSYGSLRGGIRRSVVAQMRLIPKITLGS